MQKSTLLKVISIIFIIFGALSLFSSFGAFADNAALGAVGIIASLVAILSAAMELAAGIMGIQKKDNLDLCKKLALILIVIVVVNGILGFVLVSSIANAAGATAGLGIAAGATTGVISTVFGLVLPVLYIIGIRSSANA